MQVAYINQALPIAWDLPNLNLAWRGRFTKGTVLRAGIHDTSQRWIARLDMTEAAAGSALTIQLFQSALAGYAVFTTAGATSDTRAIAAEMGWTWTS